MREVLFIAAGGALGALGRYAVGLWAVRLVDSPFPFGTLVVNVLGCFLIGVVVHLGTAAQVISPPVMTGVVIGFLGALTTFSAFGLQTVELLENDDLWRALANVLANVGLGIMATWAGLVLARSLLTAS